MKGVVMGLMAAVVVASVAAVVCVADECASTNAPAATNVVAVTNAPAAE